MLSVERSFPALVLFCAAHGAHAQASLQQTRIPIRTVTAPLAASTEPLRSLGEGTARELRDGRLLVNAFADRRLIAYDSTLQHISVLADTTDDAPMRYSFAPRLVPFLGDSTLLFDQPARSLVLLTPYGAFGRNLAIPIASFSGFGPGGGADSRGRLIYAQLAATVFSAFSCTAGAQRETPTLPDSGLIVRANFETRTLDTIARNRGPVPGIPIIVRDDDCRIVEVRWPLNPAMPSVDTWTITSDGVLAIVRGGDYHIDFLYADGRRASGQKMPFDWRRITDDSKQATLDSARRIVDSVSAQGGYRARICGQNLYSVTIGPPPANTAPGNGAAGGADVGGGGGGRGGGGGARGGGGGSGDADAAPADCRQMPLVVQFPSLSVMPDYIPPIRQIVPKADVSGNVWILPTTSSAAKDGLLYDVVNARGELFERVQLPADRDVFAFGRGDVLYLSRYDGPGRYFIERVRIVR